MARTNFDIIRGLMIADNTLDSWICETEAEEKRDLTAEEENAYIQNIVDVCEEIMQDLSCSLVEAYIRKVGKKDERNADMGSKWN